MSEVKRLPDLSGRDIGKRISMGHADNWQIDGQLRVFEVQQEYNTIYDTTLLDPQEHVEEVPADLTYEVRVGPWSAEFPGYMADEITVLVE